MTENVIIKETPDYKLEVGPDEEGIKSYLVVNKTYGVVEADTNILPQAFMYLDQIQAGLDSCRDGENKEEGPLGLVGVPAH